MIFTIFLSRYFFNSKGLYIAILQMAGKVMGVDGLQNEQPIH